jgi:hypothetical protein
MENKAPFSPQNSPFLAPKKVSNTMTDTAAYHRNHKKPTHSKNAARWLSLLKRLLSVFIAGYVVVHLNNINPKQWLKSFAIRQT